MFTASCNLSYMKAVRTGLPRHVTVLITNKHQQTVTPSRDRGPRLRMTPTVDWLKMSPNQSDHQTAPEQEPNSPLKEGFCPVRSFPSRR